MGRCQWTWVGTIENGGFLCALCAGKPKSNNKMLDRFDGIYTCPGPPKETPKLPYKGDIDPNMPRDWACELNAHRQQINAIIDYLKAKEGE